MGYKLIISDIDAGGGAIVDLSFNADTKQVKEEKIFADGCKTTTTFGIEDFEKENYGKDGEDFLTSIIEKLKP